MNCKICGANANSEYCFKHKPRTQLKKGSKPTLNSKKGFSVGKSNQMSVISSKNKEFVQNNGQLSVMKQFFMEIWKERIHKSEVSNTSLYEPVSTAYFHHILPKSKYPKAKFDKDNIILLSLDEHSNVENDIYKYEEINKRRKQLKTKYNL